MNLSSLLNASEPGAGRTATPEASDRTAHNATSYAERTEELKAVDRERIGLGEHTGELNDGRYALPLSIQTKHTNDVSNTYSSANPSCWDIRSRGANADTTTFGCAVEGDELRRGPRVPGHRLSDSQSSVQSCCSTFSNGHSRASSVTTVSDVNLTIPSHTDALPSISKLDPVREETPSSDATEVHSPSRILSGLTLQAGHASSAKGITSRALRPKSCSNAASTSRPSVDHAARVPVDSRRPQQELPLSSSIHKRASSAPVLAPNTQTSHSITSVPVTRPTESQARRNMAGMGNGESQAATAGQVVTSDIRFAPVPSPTKDNDVGKADASSPVSSGVSMSPTVRDASVADSPTVASRRDTPPSGVADADDGGEKPKDAISCMFIDRCDTGAQLRKAISHFFGRNKGCTLLIPNHIWVHYCRKHYQRVRYRNAKEYPVTQMDLVKSQVERLHLWSEENKSLGRGRVIKDWTFALRKREQQRLQEAMEAAASSHTAGANGEAGEASTNVPQWVYDSLGDGYTTDQIMGLANRFYVELQNGTLEQIPEVEFLPNIIDDGKDASGKGTRGRKQTKRKAPESEESSANHNIAAAAIREPPAFISTQAATKRPRTGDGPTSTPSVSPALAMPRVSQATRGSDVVLPSLGRPQELSPLGNGSFESGQNSASLPSFSQIEATSSTPRSQTQFYSGSQPSTPRDPFLPWNGSAQSAAAAGRPVFAPSDSSAVQRWLDSDGGRHPSPEAENRALPGYQQHYQTNPHYATHSQYSRPPSQHLGQTPLQSPRESSPAHPRPMLRPRHNTYSAQPSPVEHAHVPGHYIHGYAAAHTQSDHEMPAPGHQRPPGLVLSQPPAPRHPLHARNQSAPSRHMANKLSPVGSNRFDYSSPYAQPFPGVSGREASHARSASLRNFSASGSTPRVVAGQAAGARFVSTDGYENWRHQGYESGDPKLAQP